MTATSDAPSAPEPLTVISLTRQLRACGVSDGHTVLVHSSLKSLGYVVGGAEAVVRALLSAVGESGTLMVPTQSWRNLDPDRGVHWDAPEAYYPAIREHWPPYDPAVTPSNKMGAVAETLRTWPGARRSPHPARSFAAVGPNAERLVAEHDLEGVHGDAAPVGKLYDLDGYVLLLGVGHGSNTSLHLAETRADYPGKTFIKETRPVRCSSGAGGSASATPPSTTIRRISRRWGRHTKRRKVCARAVSAWPRCVTCGSAL